MAQDQSMVYGSFLGGSEWDYPVPAGTTVSSDGNFVTTSVSFSDNMPTTEQAIFNFPVGGGDLHIGVFDSNGQLVHATYWGGSDLESRAKSFFRNGNILIAGQTASGDLPVTQNAHQDDFTGGEDIFLSMIGVDGNLHWSTFFGGEGDDEFRDADLDIDGNVFIVGKSSSTGLATQGAFKTAPESTDGLLAKFDAQGGLVWSTYFGGSENDEIHTVVYDPLTNRLYCAGQSSSADLGFGAGNPTPASDWSLFLAAFDANTSERIWCSYYGGDIFDVIQDIEIDSQGNVLVVGQTSATVGISTQGSYQEFSGGSFDGFFASFSENGIINWATYLGGNTIDNAISLDTRNGKILVSGVVRSSGQFTEGEPLEPIFESSDVWSYAPFIMQFSEIGDLDWGTYYFTNPGGLGGSYTSTAYLTDEKFLLTSLLVETSLFNFFELGYITEDAFQGEYGGGDGDVGIHIFEDNTLSSVRMLHEENYFNLYPNPALDEVFLMPTHLNHAITKVWITDISGREVAIKQHFLNRLNISELASGTYLVFVEVMDYGICSKKLIKK